MGWGKWWIWIIKKYHAATLSVSFFWRTPTMSFLSETPSLMQRLSRRISSFRSWKVSLISWDFFSTLLALIFFSYFWISLSFSYLTFISSLCSYSSLFFFSKYMIFSCLFLSLSLRSCDIFVDGVVAPYSRSKRFWSILYYLLTFSSFYSRCLIVFSCSLIWFFYYRYLMCPLNES